ncbi:hypothetical protein AAV99_06685 [Aurantiacibacter marinus]|uniref:Lipoprotein n=2 Tax=Aurantiacibacter marinus TaxID=874156 RepID=A0A0H0XUR4_9SPHN|nr:hypothetical protein AAV99_06685 [Aurantiacibacter marinus]
MQARFLALGLISATLAACASPAEEYPSLAIRDSERLTGSMAAAEPQPYIPPPPSASALDQVEQLAATARAAHAAFLAAAPAARRLAGTAGAGRVGSEAWALAQVAIADLETRRSLTMIALADLDRIYVDTSSAGEAIAPVAQIQTQIAAMVEQENAIIAELLAATRN